MNGGVSYPIHMPEQGPLYHLNHVMFRVDWCILRVRPSPPPANSVRHIILVYSFLTRMMNTVTITITKNKYFKTGYTLLTGINFNIIEKIFYIPMSPKKNSNY